MLAEEPGEEAGLKFTAAESVSGMRESSPQWHVAGRGTVRVYYPRTLVRAVAPRLASYKKRLSFHGPGRATPALAAHCARLPLLARSAPLCTSLSPPEGSCADGRGVRAQLSSA
ncbi:hypothetical protein NDU88_001105 [Pleurodeles waltl]|uniref:Uncharacterized protein n=1 Tax=Pleurodeles waltl TaxID=8319 RepID=A0AAV7Q327_PLEWA|nr:hypothetical protein NDU88_001105 [Pleurodeles waltl]